MLLSKDKGFTFLLIATTIAVLLVVLSLLVIEGIFKADPEMTRKHLNRVVWTLKPSLPVCLSVFLQTRSKLGGFVEVQTSATQDSDIPGPLKSPSLSTCLPLRPCSPFSYGSFTLTPK